MTEEKKIEVLEFGDRKVSIDPENLRFDEMSLNQYIQTEGGYFDNFGAFLALAEKFLQRAEMQYEKVKNERFIEHKDNGDAVALAEARAETDPIVVELKDRCVEAKYKVARLKRHLLAWDKNHDNAQSMGHMLRKEMDKLHSDIYFRNRRYDDVIDHDYGYARKTESSGEPAVDKIVGDFDLDELEKEVENQ